MSSLNNQKIKGVLFDFDGTLIDSTPAINRSWGRVLTELGLSHELLETLHGVPSSQTIKRLIPDGDKKTHDEWSRKIERYEVEDTDGIVLLPGSLELLNFLDASAIPWLVVTSCTRELGLARAKAVGIELPVDTVFFTDVVRGKPDPEPFILGAHRLGFKPEECVAVEDAPAGIRSANTAEALSIAVASTHRHEELNEARYVVNDLFGVREVITSLIA